MADAIITNSTATAGAAQQNLGSTYKSQLIVANSSASTSSLANASVFRRSKLNDILVGTNTTPGDTEIEFDCALITWISSTYATITVSSFSSNYMRDYGVDPGFGAAASINSSAETGITANSEKWYIGINQRASYRWIANPDQELIVPGNSQATGNNGLDIRGRSAAYTGTVTVEGIFNEF